MVIASILMPCKYDHWIFVLGLEVKKTHEIYFQKIAHAVTSPEFLNVYNSLICIRMTHENWKSHCWLSGQKPLSQLLLCQVHHLYLWIFKNGTPLRCCDSSVTLCSMLVGMVGLNKDQFGMNIWNSLKSFDVTFSLKLNFKALGKTWLCFHTFSKIKFFTL